jgi:pimeloyl-ACP methyl ester carboxylesterase
MTDLDHKVARRTVIKGAALGLSATVTGGLVSAARAANAERSEGGEIWSSEYWAKKGASGVEDLKAAAEIVTRETGQQKFHFLGESSGALRAGAYAMVAPERAGRLVLAAFTYKGEGSPTLTKRAEQLAYFRSHNMRKRDREMIRSIATRDKPGTSDPAAVEALADAEMQFGDQIPTGTYLDMTANLPVVHPEKVLSPVLLVRGEYDGIATIADLEEFYNALPNGDRQFVILPGTAHSLALATNRHLFWHVTRAFLTMPAPIAT